MKSFYISHLIFSLVASHPRSNSNYQKTSRTAHQEWPYLVSSKGGGPSAASRNVNWKIDKAFASPPETSSKYLIENLKDPKWEIAKAWPPKSDEFRWGIVKDAAIMARETFQRDPNLVSARIQDIKFVRHFPSGKIFALSSRNIHDKAVVGQGSFARVKTAIDIDNPTASLVVKKPYAKKGNMFYAYDTEGKLKNDYNIAQEAPRLKALDLQYANVDQAISVTKTHGRMLEKQYLIQKRAPGDLMHNYLKATKNPTEIRQVIDSGLQALDALHSKGFIHSDAHLGNILYDKTTKQATIIDPGRMKSAIQNSVYDPLYDKLNFLGSVIKRLRMQGADPSVMQYAETKFKESKDQRNPKWDKFLEPSLHNRVAEFINGNFQ